MRFKNFIPVIICFTFIGIFFIALKDNPKNVSAIIGKPVPQFVLEGINYKLDNGKIVEGFSHNDLKKGVYSIVNVWASWCLSCRDEHPVLMSLNKDKRIKIFGLNYRNTKLDARKFLEKYGNPYDYIGFDEYGYTGIDWGVTKVPESFIIDGNGVIKAKITGPMNYEHIDKIIKPLLSNNPPKIDN